VPGKRSGLLHHVLFVALAVGLLCLAGRLFAFQREHHEDMARRSVGQQRMVISLPARRGNIYGLSYSRYELLASSHRVDGCFADPSMIRDESLGEVCRRIADVLGLEAREIRSKIVARRRRRFVWLSRRIDEATSQRIKELRLTGIGVQSQWRRTYPNGSLAAQVIGFAGLEGCGLEGVALTAARRLRGIDGSNRVMADAARRPIWTQPDGYTAPQDGRHIYLTIDVVIQRYLEKALADAVAEFSAESATGVVVDPATGHILAMASEPTYDLNRFGKADAAARRNRAVTDMFEPGSIFKPFVASAALAEGVVQWGETFRCHNGAWRVRRGRVLHDAYPYAALSAEAVVYKSSNIGMAQMGLRLGNERLHRIVRAFGFGSPTGVTLPGESGGQVNPLATWKRDSTFSVPMGQEVSVTALQVAMAFAALANDGVLLRPQVIGAIAAADGTVIADYSRPIPVARALDPNVCRRFVRDVLGRVPTDGTGRRYGRLDGWTSFAKTGTAQIPPFSSGKYTASYVAGAPLEAPRLVCLVSVRKLDKSGPHGGGRVAAPAVKRVLERSLAYLDVPSDEL